MFCAFQVADFFFCVLLFRAVEEDGGAVGPEGEFSGVGVEDAGNAGHVDAGAVVHGDPDGILLLLDLGDPGFVCGGFEAGHCKEILHGFRRLSEAVHQLLQHVFIFFIVFDSGNSFIGVKLQGFVADIAVGKIGVNAHIYGGLIILGHFDAFGFLHSLAEHFAVKVIPYGFHVSGLFRPQQISCSADLQVAHCYFEAAAQFREFTDCMKPLFCHFPQHFVSPVHKKCVGRPVRTSHTPSQLVQLRQAHLVRVVDNHCVHIGDIHTGLNDRRGYQNVNLPVDESVHDLFQLPLFHLSVGKSHIGLRHQLCDHVGHLRNGLHPVVDIVDLSAAGKFPVDGFPDHLFIVFAHKRLNRDSFSGRLLENTHIADSDQTHMHRPWNRGSGEGKHVYRLFHLLDFFFVRHAETLFLVDNQQSQVLERHILGQDAVGADHNVHQPLFQIRQGLFLLGSGPESAQQIHTHRKIFHPLHEGVVMLLGKDCRGHQINHLLILLHRLERRADRHLGLAESHVAADQTVHDFVTLHVLFCRLDGFQLVFRLLERKHLLKLLLPDRIRSVLVTVGRLPRRIQLHQIPGNIFHRAPHSGLCPGPLLSAQAVQLRKLCSV